MHFTPLYMCMCACLSVYDCVITYSSPSTSLIPSTARHVYPFTDTSICHPNIKQSRVSHDLHYSIHTLYIQYTVLFTERLLYSPVLVLYLVWINIHGSWLVHGHSHMRICICISMCICIRFLFPAFVFFGFCFFALLLFLPLLLRLPHHPRFLSLSLFSFCPVSLSRMTKSILPSPPVRRMWGWEGDLTRLHTGTWIQLGWLVNQGL